MIFGPTRVEDALGTILAHSLDLGGKRLRKGVTLDADHLTALAQAGHSLITVARLDEGDVHENDAAKALANALVPDQARAGIDIKSASTGRANLHASVFGVAEIDVEAINAVNAVHPMITIATVAPWHHLAQGKMLATVKIISYAVPKQALDRACTLARAALRMRATAVRDAQLIQTVTGSDDGEKGHRAIVQRCEAMQVAMGPKTVVAHQIAPLAEALKAATADVILILTGSATSDAHDVAPQAVRAAGGQVHHFGMPVDPGNLLFLGQINDRPVIGLPGCARSPALNGADWVMQRIFCGVPVTGKDIAGMGVGGLLKESPARPHPREGGA